MAYYNRGIAYYFKREYEKSWKDVEKAQSLAYQIDPKFLDELRKAWREEKIEKAITADDTDEGERFCDECNKEIK